MDRGAARHARLYNELLAGGDVEGSFESPNARHVYHLYVIRTPRRDETFERLKSKGIGTGIHYPVPLHRQPAYLKQGYRDISLPITEHVASEVLSLPMYPELSDEQIKYVAQAVNGGTIMVGVAVLGLGNWEHRQGENSDFV